ncbi:MAG TPA: molybdopterin-guanine dinucleotide biosynthesis protein B [Syntrophorhabdales bacterium]|nr:molybdopterin-guanine dinucleotide biosynthesis protein B [Syntrophorhabdales bacterium]
MGRRVIPVLSVIGRSNTGKTTVIEKLIPMLNAKNIRVATIKHHLHDFESDRQGKDSYRLKKAGARISMIVSPQKVAFTADTERELTLAELVSAYIRDVDLVIVEGFKEERAPKIEIYRYSEGIAPLCRDDRDVIALMSDRPVDAPVPVLSRDDVEKAAEMILSILKLNIGSGVQGPGSRKKRTSADS